MERMRDLVSSAADRILQLSGKEGNIIVLTSQIPWRSLQKDVTLCFSSIYQDCVTQAYENMSSSDVSTAFSSRL